MFISKFKDLKFLPILEICNLDFVFFWLGIQYDSIVWVIMRRQGVYSERRRSSCSSFLWNCPQINVARPHWSLVNNGLVPVSDRQNWEFWMIVKYKIKSLYLTFHTLSWWVQAVIMMAKLYSPTKFHGNRTQFGLPAPVFDCESRPQVF